jgi:3-oxoacyl-[acyl-carrier-protein] synthase-3
MAVRAARTAIERSGLDRGCFGLMLHASAWFQGLEMWPAASYIAHEVLGSRPYAIDVSQSCAGGMAALRLATAWLNSGFGSTALITTADRFAPPGMDRWGLFVEAVFGDGGTAVVLSTETGFARVLSTATMSDNAQEGWMRGDQPFATTPGTERPVQLLSRAIAQASRMEPGDALRSYQECMLGVRDQALAAANVTLGEISRAIVPFVHRGDGKPENYDLLGFTEAQSLWGYGQHTGHLGAGDQFAGLNYLAENKELSSGELIFLLGVGAGNSFSAAVLEILTPPVCPTV